MRRINAASKKSSGNSFYQLTNGLGERVLCRKCKEPLYETKLSGKVWCKKCREYKK